MGIRQLARQRAMQLLYALEYAAPGEEFADVERRFLGGQSSRRRGWGPFARQLAGAAYEQRASLDDAIRPCLRKWSPDRLPKVDLLCLRLALCELREFPDIPLRVTINEYIDLSRMFGTDESPQYINAVLDRLARDFPHKDFQSGEDEAHDSIPSALQESEPDHDKPAS